MNLRLAILILTKKYRLSAEAGDELKRYACLDEEPPALSRQLPFGMALAGASFSGLGIIFWIAANWESFSRLGRFTLLQATLACLLFGSWRHTATRVPLALAGFLVCGGLFAYFGQTYQTGADPWQLFGLWALLTLPMCFGVRHDALWVAWTVIALTAALLWSQIDIGLRWNGSPYRASLGSWVPASTLALAFKFIPVKFTGTGIWPMRLCMIYAAIGLSTTSTLCLFHSSSDGLFVISLSAIGALAYAFSRPKLFDVFVLSALGLSANIVLVSGLSDLFLRMNIGDVEGALFLSGCIASCMLAGTVKYISHLTSLHTRENVS